MNKMIEKIYYENGIKITRIPEKKRKNNTVIKSSSRIQHQKGSFGSREPSGNGVSKIYDSIYDRKSRNGKEGKINTKATENRAW
tara:strand:+ start:233 stop:484 length:252 start_codon:yes stop_codon:yes gene_type:complete